MDITGFTLGELQTNAYLCHQPGEEDCWVVDMPGDPRELILSIKEKGFKPKELWLTHAHGDHIAGIPEFLDEFPGTPVFLHPKEWAFLEDPLLNLSAYFPPAIKLDLDPQKIEHGQTFQWGKHRGQVLFTPGHSPGSCCFFFAETKQLLAGDTLFRQSIGRYDFPTSNGQDLFRSLEEILMSLDDDVLVFPGHGASTSIGFERKSNPYLQK